MGPTPELGPEREPEPEPEPVWTASRQAQSASSGSCRTVQPEPEVCGICCDLAPLTQLTSEGACNHRYCKKCLVRYLNDKIDEVKVATAFHITCPACEQQVDDVRVKKLLAEEEKAQRVAGEDIEASRQRRRLEKYRNLRGWWRATPTCPPPGKEFVGCPQCWKPVRRGGRGTHWAGKLVAKGLRNLPWKGGYGDVHCDACGLDFCEKHLDKHPGKSCAQYREETADLSKSKRKELGIKLCPACKSPIQKNLGCRHMTCSECKHNFCWKCLKPWGIYPGGGGSYEPCKCSLFGRDGG